MRQIFAAILLTLTVNHLAAATPAVRPVVNINTATVAQLAYLPGVGQKVAVAIVAARPYRTPAEIDKAKGIGPKKLVAVLPYVVVSGATTATTKIKVTR